MQYGDSFNQAGEILATLYPEGVSPQQYVDLLSVARIVDKLFRIASSTPEERAEWSESPYRDIGGYGVLGAERDERIQERFHKKAQPP